jgi:hypothetical protein
MKLLLQTVLQLPAVQQLQPAALARLQVAAYTKRLPLPLLQQLCKGLPAVPLQEGLRENSTLWQLLLLSFKEQCWEVFDWLSGLPGVGLLDGQVALCCTVRGWQLQADKQ